MRHVLNHPDLQARLMGRRSRHGDGPDGRITACNSDWEYPPYLRRKIILQLTAIGSWYPDTRRRDPLKPPKPATSPTVRGLLFWLHL